MANVEMPDGTTRSYATKTITELKEQVSISIGVESDELTVLGDDNRPIGNNDPVPAHLRVIPKPKWG